MEQGKFFSFPLTLAAFTSFLVKTDHTIFTNSMYTVFALGEMILVPLTVVKTTGHM
jgi:hypothetical protein